MAATKPRVGIGGHQAHRSLERRARGLITGAPQGRHGIGFRSDRAVNPYTTNADVTVL